MRTNLLDNGVLDYLLKCCQQRYNARCFADYGTNNNNDDSEDSLSSKQQYITLFKNLSWSISNFCRYGGHKGEHLGKLLQCLYVLLQHRDIINEDDNNPFDQESFGGNIGWSFTYLTNDIDLDDENNEMLRIMNDNGITSELIKLLGSSNIYTVHSTLRGVGNILTGQDSYTWKCIEYGVLPYLKKLMVQYHNKTVISNGRTSDDTKLKELCWAISNITAGPKEHIIEVIKQEFIPILIDILAGSRNNVSQEALWALSNATAGADKKIMDFLVEQGLIKGLCKYFKNRYSQQQYHNGLDKLLMVALECIDGILQYDIGHKFGTEFEEYGGIDFLEYLQSDDNISQAVYDRAQNIIKQYFGGDDDDQLFNIGNDNNNNINNTVNIDCNVNGNQFGFGINTNNNNNNTTNNNTSNSFSF